MLVDFVAVHEQAASQQTWHIQSNQFGTISAFTLQQNA
jgi:hypothetical protein